MLIFVFRRQDTRCLIQVEPGVELRLFDIALVTIYFVRPGRSENAEAVWTISNKVAISQMACKNVKVNISSVPMVCCIQRGDLCEKWTRILGQRVEIDPVDDNKKSIGEQTSCAARQEMRRRLRQVGHLEMSYYDRKNVLLEQEDKIDRNP